LDDPNEVVKPLTPRTMGSQVNAEAGMKYDPAVRGSQQQDRNIQSFYTQYKNELAGIQQNTERLYGQAQATQQAGVASTSALDEQQRQVLA